MGQLRRARVGVGVERRGRVEAKSSLSRARAPPLSGSGQGRPCARVCTRPRSVGRGGEAARARAHELCLLAPLSSRPREGNSHRPAACACVVSGCVRGRRGETRLSGLETEMRSTRTRESGEELALSPRRRTSNRRARADRLLAALLLLRVCVLVKLVVRKRRVCVCVCCMNATDASSEPSLPLPTLQRRRRRLSRRTNDANLSLVLKRAPLRSRSCSVPQLVSFPRP